MASWAAVLALTGFQYSGVDKTMTFAPKEGRYFWSNGYAWGTCSLKKAGRGMSVELTVLQGQVTLSTVLPAGLGQHQFKEPLAVPTGSKASSLSAGARPMGHEDDGPTHRKVAIVKGKPLAMPPGLTSKI